MIHNAFLFPEALQDTPRLFTAIAEWLAVFVYLNIYKRKFERMEYAAVCVISFVVITLFQWIAGLLSIWFWMLTMMGAVGLMYASLRIILDIKPFDCGVLVTHAFVLAEFAASLYRQLYVWLTLIIGKETFLTSLMVMGLTYGTVYILYYRVERGNFTEGADLNIMPKDFFSTLALGIGVFLMSNLSFVWENTPFSATGNLLYVRTLVDFGGMMMLMTQMGRRNEMAIKMESDAISSLFRKQYEQYKLAVDNSELLRKEMHDMKHYVMALKNEDDANRRADILEDMEQAIAVQEAFMNTGNQVLDVVLTTKSLQCSKKGITLNAMVDGDTLSQIHVKDICSLFGNMLDNAIEATQMVSEKEKRLITLTVHRRNQFTVIECENYSDAPLKLQNGLISTTKADKIHHGFGLKSLQKIAEKYGGGMTISKENGWFQVKILLSVG